MDTLAWHTLRQRTLWRVVGHHFNERHAPRAVWWHSNRTRLDHTLIVQVMRAGRAVLRQGGSDQPIVPGDLFLFAHGDESLYGRPPDRPEWPGHDDVLITDFIALSGAGLREHWDLLRARHGSVIHLPERSPFYIAMRDAIAPGPGPERVSALVMAIAQAIEDAVDIGRSPVAQAIDAILADPCVEHNLKAIADRCGCSREHLSRVFQEQIGLPPAQWMRQRRLERALSLLCDTNLPLPLVAKHSGAGTLHRLARWTNDLRGMPPLRLRHHLRKEAEKR
jgi:AraC-like DNA-binding protein